MAKKGLLQHPLRGEWLWCLPWQCLNGKSLAALGKIVEDIELLYI